jgi:hypothetical protein
VLTYADSSDAQVFTAAQPTTMNQKEWSRLEQQFDLAVTCTYRITDGKHRLHQKKLIRISYNSELNIHQELFTSY